jgi:hypothetical protein
MCIQREVAAGQPGAKGPGELELLGFGPSMPTKRTTVGRPRTPTITPEALALFLRLERVPPHRRHHEDFRDQARELARLVGLGSEFGRATISPIAVASRANRPNSPAPVLDPRSCRAGDASASAKFKRV